MPRTRHHYKEARSEHYRTFCTVAHLGSYSAAGLALGLSRSTVWQQMEVLERELHVKLTRRRARGMELTAEGATLLALIEEPVAALDSVGEVFRARLSHAAGTLRLASVPGTELMTTIRELRKRSPDVQFTMIEKRSQEIVPLVEEGTCDLGFALALPGVPRSPRLHVETVAHRSIGLTVPLRHPLARKEIITPEDLVRDPLVTWQRDNPLRAWLESTLERFGVRDRMRVAVETDHLDSTEQCVALGLGVGIGSCPRGRRSTVPLRVRILDDLFPPLPLVLLWKKGKLLTPSAVAFVELMKESIQNHTD